MKKIFFLMLFAFPVHAADVQWSQGFNIDCDNPTERSDGTPLEVTEITSIKYYIFKDGEATTPEYTHEAFGACAPTLIDTKQGTTGIKNIFATTKDTDGRESSSYSNGLTHTIIKSRPKPPRGLR
jgi:hypothetical protein